MARLASIEKAGFFACPTNALVLRHIRLDPWAVAPIYILDPCAGEGSAVHTFAQALASLPTSTMAAHYADMAAQCQRRIHVRAVEIDAERARAAKALLGEQNVVHSAIESVSAVGQSCCQLHRLRRSREVTAQVSLPGSLVDVHNRKPDH